MTQEPEDKSPEAGEGEAETQAETVEEVTPVDSIAEAEEEDSEDDDGDTDDEDLDPKDKRIDELETELNSVRTNFLRARADLENFRKRTMREKEEHAKFANRRIFTELLDVMDNFDRAMTAIQDPKDNFVIGVKMIQKQLTDVLGAQGVEEIPVGDRAFDPYLDEAIAREHTNDHEENAILEVFQKGYRFKGQLLRPTKVKVAVRLETEESSETEPEAGAATDNPGTTEAGEA